MKDDIVYEYASINVKRELEQMYKDCYEHFGWIYIKDEEKRDYYINTNINQDIVNIKFKRNRKIQGKDELQELQNKCEKAFLKINKLEREPDSLATMYALLIGLIAILFITVSIFSGIKSNWFISIVSGMIGIIGIILPYFIYNKTKGNKKNENKVKIEKEQDLISDIFKRATEILFENEE